MSGFVLPIPKELIIETATEANRILALDAVSKDKSGGWLTLRAPDRAIVFQNKIADPPGMKSRKYQFFSGEKGDRLGFHTGDLEHHITSGQSRDKDLERYEGALLLDGEGFEGCTLSFSGLTEIADIFLVIFTALKLKMINSGRYFNAVRKVEKNLNDRSVPGITKKYQDRFSPAS